jgi:hypothetical protein
MMPDTFKPDAAENDPQATTSTENNLPADKPHVGSDIPDRDKPQTQEGKLVFSPNELNQAGEDKEYFHPEKDHKFDAPKDANKHALTPDVEVTPDNKIKPIGS